MYYIPYFHYFTGVYVSNSIINTNNTLNSIPFQRKKVKWKHTTAIYPYIIWKNKSNLMYSTYLKNKFIII
jgi:hypothetical protein